MRIGQQVIATIGGITDHAVKIDIGNGQAFAHQPVAARQTGFEMGKRGIAFAHILVENGRLAGILSERDYARKVILQGKSSHDTPVKEIMTERVVCVQPKNTVEECMALMTDKRIRHLPVLENDQLIGVLSIGDLVKETISEQQVMIQQLETYIHS